MELRLELRLYTPAVSRCIFASSGFTNHLSLSRKLWKRSFLALSEGFLLDIVIPDRGFISIYCFQRQLFNSKSLIFEIILSLSLS